MELDDHPHQCIATDGRQSMYSQIFSPFNLAGIELRNRLTMTPLYLGYAGEAGLVNEPILDHYRFMAQSGVALVVVENASTDHPIASVEIHGRG
jgi:NADPH2 dehydrogenase